LDEGRRIEALETRLSFQENTITELSAEVFSQARRIERLERQIRELIGKVKEAADAAEQPAPADVKPPHW